MSQHDFVIDNQDGASFRGDINGALQALASCSSGAAAPSPTYPGQLWRDTGTSTLKMRNDANTAWLELGADVLGVRPLVQGAAVATTSGTSIDLSTSIPSWAKRITVMLNGVSTTGTNSLLVQLGAGSVTTSGYNSLSAATHIVSGLAGLSSTAGMAIFNNAAANSINAIMTLAAVGANVWVSSHSGHYSTTSCMYGGGNITLTGALDRLRITTVGGTDTFDAGSVNILYE